MVLITLLLTLFASVAHAGVEPTMVPDEIVLTETEDGWTLPLRHYEAEGPPVILVHGMWANHYNWDYRPEISLAHHLQQEGFDVWVAGLRGDPMTEAPGWWEARQFTFDDHAEHDLPALIETIKAETGREQVLWVGHSMGGMLLYAYLRDHPEDIAAAVTVSSPAAFEHASAKYRAARWVRHLLVGPRVRASRVGALLRAMGPDSPIYEQVSGQGNIPWALGSTMSKHAVVDLPRQFVLHAGEWIETGAVVDTDGEPWIEPRDVPVLALAGGGDETVHALDVAHICEVYTDCEFELVSRSAGYARDYGHVDILVGLSSRDDVYPTISTYLRDSS